MYMSRWNKYWIDLTISAKRIIEMIFGREICKYGLLYSRIKIRKRERRVDKRLSKFSLVNLYIIRNNIFLMQTKSFAYL